MWHALYRLLGPWEQVFFSGQEKLCKVQVRSERSLHTVSSGLRHMRLCVRWEK